VNPEWLSISQLRGWLADCNANHGDACHNILETFIAGGVPSMTLIDLRQECLTIPLVAVEYVALSYVVSLLRGSTHGSFEHKAYKYFLI
jgi:hypothetical protein